MSDIFHGPRAFIIAPPGRTFVSFDADGLHYRIAAMYSKDPFICEAMAKYDETKDPVWKPHVRNCSALFRISPEEAVKLMEKESPKYTFAKNFIFMYLNGGTVPALANSAVSAGLLFQEDEVQIILDNWKGRAILFEQWRTSLTDQVAASGMLTLPSGRRRRFYNITFDKKTGGWKLSHKVIKEIYNFPLLGTEVDYMNPRFVRVLEWTEENPQWMLVLHSHDGMILEGPESEALQLISTLMPLLRISSTLAPGYVLDIPWDSKVGKCWANMKKVKNG